MRTNILQLTLHDLRIPILFWGLFLAFFAFAVPAFYPLLLRFPDLAAEVDHALGNYQIFTDFQGHIESPAGFFNFTSFTSILPIVFSITGVIWGNATAAIHWSQGSLELFLARPVGRSRLMIEKFGGLVAAVGLLAVPVWAILTLRNRSLGILLDPGRLAQSVLGLVFLGICFSSLAMLVRIAFPPRVSSLGISFGLLAVAAVFYLLPGLGEGFTFFRFLSPIYYAVGGDPLENGLPIVHLFVLLGFTGAFLGGALWIFNRSDL